MFLYKSLIFTLLSSTFVAVKTQEDGIVAFSNILDSGIYSIENLKADLYFMENKMEVLEPEKVTIQLFYECLCGGCIEFDTTSLSPTVEKLASYLKVQLYPYGNAQTIDDGNGKYEFKCQHGPAECYGNKLHACAIDNLANNTKAVFFNSCMMKSSGKNRGSDDEAADECGKSMRIDSEPIKQCAKGDRGPQLLKYYGDESKKVGFQYVPYILINGVLNNGDKFFHDVCATFKTPPPACSEVLKNNNKITKRCFKFNFN